MFSFQTTAWAQPQASSRQSQTDAISAEAAVPSRFGFQGVFEPSSALKSPDDPSYSASADLHLLPSWKVSEHWKFLSLWTVTQDWTGERSTRLTRSEIRGVWSGGRLGEGLTYGAHGALILPLAAGKRAEESLYLGVRLAPKVTWDLEPTYGLPLSLEGEVALSRNVHEFSTHANGTSNTQMSIWQRALAAIALGKHWGISSQLTYYSLWSYQSELTNKFKWDQEVSYSPTERWALALGLSNFAGGMRANGQDSNLGLFDYETTVIYGSIAFSI